MTVSSYFSFSSLDEMSAIDFNEWRNIAPNFVPSEILSKGDGSLLFSKDTLSKLQRLRHKYGKPLTINSGYRDPDHNKKVGGSAKSQHVKGHAVDIAIDSLGMGRELEDLAVKCGFTAIGRYKTFIHVDDRPPKSNGGGFRWGSWGW